MEAVAEAAAVAVVVAEAAAEAAEALAAAPRVPPRRRGPHLGTCLLLRPRCGSGSHETRPPRALEPPPRRWRAAVPPCAQAGTGGGLVLLGRRRHRATATTTTRHARAGRGPGGRDAAPAPRAALLQPRWRVPCRRRSLAASQPRSLAALRVRPAAGQGPARQWARPLFPERARERVELSRRVGVGVEPGDGCGRRGGGRRQRRLARHSARLRGARVVAGVRPAGKLAPRPRPRRRRHLSCLSASSGARVTNGGSCHTRRVHRSTSIHTS